MPLDFSTINEGKHVLRVSDLVPGLPTGSGEEYLCVIANGGGPTVVLLGGIHGDEFEAQIVLRRLAERLHPDKVTGRLIVLPCINFPAAHSGKRISPSDHQNMNRVFPGKAEGTPTEMLAYLLAEVLLPQADLLIDAHAGGANCTVVPMVFGFADPRCGVGPSRLDDIMEAWGYRYVQHVSGVPSTACGIALQKGVASIEIEGGGGGRLLASEMEAMEAGILRGLAAAGVMAPVLPAVPFQGVHLDVGAANQILAVHPGLVEHVVRLGEIVAEGETVARLHHVSGGYEAPTELKAGAPGVVLRQADSVFVDEGGLVANTGSKRPCAS